jgi:HD-like signal output (HDOD) protein
MADISELFTSIELPVMPEVGLALITTLDQEDTGIAEIGALIAQDPALAAKLLALANSAAFGLPRKVASLDNALRLVGLSRVRALALSACLHNAFSMPQGIDSKEFWTYSMACAGYAQWLVEGVDPARKVDRQTAWLTALMLRLGQLIIGHAVPERVADMQTMPCPPGQRWSRERMACGFDEGEVMAELSRRWHFPKEIVGGLLLASDPLAGKPMATLAGIVHLAARLADDTSAGQAAIDQLPVPVMSTLELKYGWMKTSFPDAKSFSAGGALEGS